MTPLTLAILFVLFVLLVFLVLFHQWSLRDPEREIPEGKNLVSPADGTVIKVMEYEKDNHLIAIFMSPLDVHVNRAPIAGRVISQTHTRGSFHRAFSFEHAFLENERNEITIQGELFSVQVIQIAGWLARRIHSFVAVGEEVKKGQRIGMITFGSQCTLILPKTNLQLAVSEGEKVKAGSSIIATILPS